MIKVCYPFVGDTLGGSHISSLTLINFVNNQKFDIKPNVLVFSASNSFKEYLSNNNISYTDFGLKLGNYSKLTIIVDIIRSFFRVIKYLKDEKIDIVHTNDLRINLIFLRAIILLYFFPRLLFFTRSNSFLSAIYLFLS